MIITDFENIDYSKYKRVFVFGCSFTNYMWPTWADILVKQMPNAEYYNLAMSGAGNPYITQKILENNLFHKFNSDDLVLVMYSTYCREDRYINNGWVNPGNIFTCGFYDEDFIKKYSDTRGYLIRDITLIEFASIYLESLPCDTVQLLSVPWDYQTIEYDVTDILKTYSKTTERFKTTLFEMNGKEFVCGHHYYWDAQSKTEKFGDYHPNTLMYYYILKKMGFNLSTEVFKYSAEVTYALKQCNTRVEFEMTGAPYIPKRMTGPAL